MDYSFRRAPDGQVLVTLPTSRAFTEALNDAVTSMPPRGDRDSRQSTYWIDRALRTIDELSGSAAPTYVQGGNEASLWLDGDTVRAHSDYELFDDDSMPVSDLVGLLEAWRAEVVEARTSSPARFADTYRRNPYPD